jgi:aminoglycoside phosphotransferase (APT) family kinase protein
MTVGDPATDLASIWMLFADLDARQQALAAYGDLPEATMAVGRNQPMACSGSLISI